MELVYLEPAKRDLERIRAFYLANEVDLKTANGVILSIISDTGCLTQHPKQGFSIGGKHGYESHYRGLLVHSERYLCVYELVKNSIEIRRIYSTKENYIKDLLP